MTFADTKISLPPFCKGKSSGNLKLIIKNVCWNPKNATNNQIFKVNVLWWGQEKGHDASISSSKKAEKVVEYKINTSPKLFQLYLNNCEPIQLKFFSSKGFLGSSKFVVDFCLEKSTFWVKEAKIYNSINCVGSLTLFIETQNMTLSNTKMKVSHKICLTRTMNNITTNHKSLSSKKKVVSFNDLMENMKKDPISERTVEIPNGLDIPKNINYNTMQVKVLNTRITDFDPIHLSSRQEKWFLKCAVTSKIFCDNDEVRILSSPLTSLQNGSCKYN